MNMRNLFGRDALNASRHYDEMRSGDNAKKALDWARKSKKNIRALMRVAVVSEIAGESDAIRSLDLTELAREARMVGTRRRRKLAIAVPAAAGVLVLLFVGVNYLLGQKGAGDVWQTYSTVGLPGTRVWLADGTDIEMAPGAILRAHVTGAERTVLLDLGEAKFAARHLDSGPRFRVRSRDLIAEARGTRFGVRVTDEGSRVDVSEGVVEARGTAPGSAVEVLRSGDAQSFPRQGGTERSSLPPDPTPVDERGRSLFSRTPLSEVASAFNRVNTTRRIIVQGPAQAQTLTAAIRLDDPDKLAQILGRRPELSVVRNGRDVVITMKGAQ